MSFDPQKLADDLRWLQDHPWFIEKPASISEFLGPGYLQIESKVRPGLKTELSEIFGETVNGYRIAKYQKAMFTGAIGIGKTTIASIVIPYMTHWVLCLKDPQDYYDLLPGSRIAFMQMSTSESQAKDVVFGDIKARIEYSPWFMHNFPFDPNFKNELHFPKDTWIIPGNSAETTFEGYNILGGILDEADSHKVTQLTNIDYAENGYNTINSRIESRFDDRGFLMVIGQMKKASGFAKRKYDELRKDSKAHTIRMTIWESFGWDKYTKNGERDSFFYDVKRKQIIPRAAGQLIEDSDNILEIPTIYLDSFRNNPEKALRDLAGIPPAAGDPFISLTYKIEEARDRWIEAHDNIGSPVTESSDRPAFKDWFTANDSLKRAAHLDVAYSAEGDALGLAMGHVPFMIEVEGESKPYIRFDFLLRIRAAPGTEIFLQSVRRLIYEIKDDRRFKLRTVSMDGFESTEMRQQLAKRRFQVLSLSVDKSKLPYEDLRDAINEDRIDFPPYVTYLYKGDLKTVEIALKELMELEEGDRKIDHPPGGSKDVADSMAGVCTTLMGDRSYRRKLSSAELLAMTRQNVGSQPEHQYSIGRHQVPVGGMGLSAPLPPSSDEYQHLTMPVPPRLRP